MSGVGETFVLTFSLLRSSSNISSISCRQSSCMVWNDSCGVVMNGERAISSSRPRISWNVGREYVSWFQQSGQRKQDVFVKQGCPWWQQSQNFAKLLDELTHSLSLGTVFPSKLKIVHFIYVGPNYGQTFLAGAIKILCHECLHLLSAFPSKATV